MTVYTLARGKVENKICIRNPTPPHSLSFPHVRHYQKMMKGVNECQMITNSLLEVSSHSQACFPFLLSSLLSISTSAAAPTRQGNAAAVSHRAPPGWSLTFSSVRRLNEPPYSSRRIAPLAWFWRAPLGDCRWAPCRLKKWHLAEQWLNPSDEKISRHIGMCTYCRLKLQWSFFEENMPSKSQKFQLPYRQFIFFYHRR